LAQASSGVYCGPLRLLAHEVFEKLNDLGCATTLLTGQQHIETQGARHTSCTIEMLDTLIDVEVAVIDEIQMIASDDRGWAWTRAMLGVAADEVHLCGNESVHNLIQRMCAITGDTLEVKRYNRLSPLRVEKSCIDNLSRLGAGDCVVAFSRKKIYQLKQAIERRTKHKCCVVYACSTEYAVLQAL
jgi:ATP-dependent RNA helicase SUPV3L1/SUV3